MNPSLSTEPAEPPSLWNPNAAANWSLLFSPAFGAFIHARNAKALGRLEEAAANRMWFYGIITYLALSLFTILFPSIPDAPFRLISLILLLTWYFSLGKKQARFVKATYGAGYTRKCWSRPLIIGFASLIGFLMVAFAFGIVAAVVHGG